GRSYPEGDEPPLIHGRRPLECDGNDREVSRESGPLQRRAAADLGLGGSEVSQEEIQLLPLRIVQFRQEGSSCRHPSEATSNSQDSVTTPRLRLPGRIAEGGGVERKSCLTRRSVARPPGS